MSRGVASVCGSSPGETPAKKKRFSTKAVSGFKTVQDNSLRQLHEEAAERIKQELLANPR
eukprot:6324774-Lingulodinium_polyedra.AAC.1